jgi:hypothetical protein
MLAAAKQQGAKPVMPTEPTGRTARRTGLVALLAALLAVPLALGAATYPRWSGSLMGIADWNGTQFSSAYPFPMILSGTGTGSISVTQGTSPWVTSTPDVRAVDQSINSATPSAAYTVPANGQGEVGFSIAGLTASTATLTPECTNNIGAASPVWAGCMAISGNALNATITADGAYRVESGGRTGVRLRVTTTGTGTVTISSTAAATSSLMTMAQSLPAGTNVIGHVIADTGSTTAVTSLPGSPMQQTGGTVGPPAIVGYGVLSLTAVSTAMSTLTLSPNSGAWAVTGMVFIKNRSASASNAYVCPMAGVCTSAVGIELVPGQAYGFTNPASAMTVIAASTATVEAQW